MQHAVGLHIFDQLGKYADFDSSELGWSISLSGNNRVWEKYALLYGMHVENIKYKVYCL